MVKILVVIPCLEYPEKTIQSINNQTIKCDYILATNNSYPNKTKGERVSIAINESLSNHKLKDYDWLLKIDSDTTIPQNFIEENIKFNYELMGTGRALLLNIHSFYIYCNGIFYPTVSDDEYIIHEFEIETTNIYKRKWVIPPDSIHEEPKISVKTKYLIGIQNGRMNRLMNIKQLIKHPIYIIGEIIGFLFYQKLPYVEKKKIKKYFNKWGFLT